jgi:flavin-dependent dehydrogenase
VRDAIVAVSYMFQVRVLGRKEAMGMWWMFPMRDAIAAVGYIPQGRLLVSQVVRYILQGEYVVAGV